MQIQLDPTRWLIAIAGFINDWMFSREWSKILLYSIPALLFLVMLGAVFTGSRLDRAKLRNHYIELGTTELQAWQEQLGKPGSLPNNPEESKSEEAAKEPESDNSKTQLSAYAEMLFRRAHLLEPNMQTQFVIGATLWQRGVIPSARQTLQKIAPTDSKGFPAAHAFLAKICADEYVKTRQPKLFEEFQHHALYAVDWPHTFPDVLITEANVLWQQRKVAEAIEYLQKAVKSHPEFYALLVERLRATDQPVLAQAARKEGLEHFQTELEKNPKSEITRVQLAELYLIDPEGDATAEALLTEGLKIQQSKVYSRYLSEVYRLRFARQAEKNKGQNIDLKILERALQTDPNNAKIAETIAALISQGIKANEQMGEELNRVLASGQATMATHALLSEYHLQNGRLNEAKSHLEQVYRAAPMSVKYANNLAYLYARERRLEEAEKIASQTLALLQANKAMREPFIDELLDTLGMIYQARDKTNDAISAYEASLKLNQKRIETRTRLVALYRKIGNEGVAKAHEEAIKKIEQATREDAASKVDGESSAQPR
ncbi:MAG: tetratricopeptide repeat protein [Pirellulales bacterium]